MDPYTQFVDMARKMGSDPPLDLRETRAEEEGAAVRLRIGVVDTAEPLCVKVAGLKQKAKVLKINERLTKGAKWKLKHPDEIEVEQTELDLEAKDQVLMLTCDDQTFYIIMKVVAAS